MAEPDDLEALAAQVADGAVIDWERVEATPMDDERRRLVRRLRALADVALQHRIVSARSGELTDPASPLLTSWGPLQVLARVGQGAFSEVFRAWDPQLDREVALKLLRPEASGPGTRAHLDEARLLARVRHPNVVLVLGVGEHDGRQGIWTEFINGRTLAEMVARDGPFETTTAIAIGRTLARALSAVHRADLLHRDVKPSNVMQEDSGRLVLMDLGTGADRSAGYAGQATGTPVAVAPEILEGVRESAQSDVYSLGVVLFHLLTGTYPVTGASVAAVSESHRRGTRRRLSELRPDLPTRLVQIVEHALAEDPTMRLATADAVDAALARVEQSGAEVPGPVVGPRRRWVWLAVPAALLLGVVVGAMWPRGNISETVAGAFVVPAPSGTVLGSVALSPDGRTMAFVARDAAQHDALWVRPIDTLQPKLVAGTAGARLPFWSPDGSAVGFFADGSLKIQRLDGGPARVIAEAPDPRGAAWGHDDAIVFAPRTAGSLRRVSALGGAVSDVSTLEAGEVSHRFPSFLPDGRRLIYLSRSATRADDALFVSEPGKAGRVRLLSARSNGAITPQGRLVLWRGGALVWHAVDLDSLRVSPNAQVIAEDVTYLADHAEALFAVSPAGTLVFRSGQPAHSQLTWFDRTGKGLGILGTPHNYRNIELSPDGSRLAAEWLDPIEGTDDIWIMDWRRDVTARLTFSSANDGDPVWSPDGSRLLFTSNVDGHYRLYEKAASGEAAEMAWPAHPLPVFPEHWSADGRHVVVVAGDEGERDLYMLAPRGQIRRLFSRVFARDEAQFAPDVRSVAYQSSESGRSEVFLVGLDDTRRQVQVSPAGGAQPRWRADGLELFFLALDGSVMSAPVTPSTMQVGTARALFRPSIDTSTSLNQFVVTPDGARFLLAIPQEQPQRQSYALLLNWTARD